MILKGYRLPRDKLYMWNCNSCFPAYINIKFLKHSLPLNQERHPYQAWELSTLPWQLSKKTCFKSGYHFVLKSSCKEKVYYSDSYCANNWEKAITHKRELGQRDTYLELRRTLGNTAHTNYSQDPDTVFIYTSYKSTKSNQKPFSQYSKF